MSDRLRFGMIGCGDFAHHFLEYLTAVADVVAVCDVDPIKCASLQKKFDLQVPSHDDYRPMIDAGGLDAVAITAANFVHCAAVCAAAEAGLHVYCEKAMALDTREAWQMAHAAQNSHVKLMIGHKRRLRPPWARMIELTNDALLGEPLALSVTQYADMRPYKYGGTWWARKQTGGGLYHVYGVHVIDWFRAMCGDAKRVTAVAGPKLDTAYEYPDIAHATFEFHGGAIASLQTAMSFPLRRFRESQGPMGQCRLGGFLMEPFMDHMDLSWQRLDEGESHHERFDDLGFDHAFELEVSDFVRWVQKDRQPCLTWVEGLRCVEMMEAACRSFESGGEPVDLPLYPELEG